MDIKKILTSMREKIDPNFNFVDNTDQKIPFHNLEKRISEIEDSGINVDFERSDEQDSIEYYIKISK